MPLPRLVTTTCGESVALTTWRALEELASIGKDGGLSTRFFSGNAVAAHPSV
jgi:hypothetical protein